MHSAPSRAGPNSWHFAATKTHKMLKQDATELATTERLSPIEFSTRTNFSLRFCLEYQTLNAITVRECYSLPRINECIDWLGEATIFSTLDASSSYCQIVIVPKYCEKTELTRHDSLFHFTRIPFWLRNAPATSQTAMYFTLSCVKWKSALVYLDDIVAFSKTIKDHMAHLRQVPALLRDSGITLDLKNCSFLAGKIG